MNQHGCYAREREPEVSVNHHPNISMALPG